MRSFHRWRWNQSFPWSSVQSWQYGCRIHTNISTYKTIKTIRTDETQMMIYIYISENGLNIKRWSMTPRFRRLVALLIWIYGAQRSAGLLKILTTLRAVALWMVFDLNLHLGNVACCETTIFKTKSNCNEKRCKSRASAQTKIEFVPTLSHLFKPRPVLS